MAFKFYIDGQLTDQPDNDMELITTIKRDPEMGGFVIVQDVTLSYNGNNAPPAGTISGYSYLKNKFNSGSCNLVEIVIYDEIGPTQTYRLYTGTIIVPSMEIQEHQVTLTSKIDDNGFYAYIKNNKRIPFNLYSNRSKNGVLITPPQVYEVDMFDSQTATYLSTIGNLYQGYRIQDVLSYLISAISDGKVGFQSDLLDNMTGQLFIFDGAALVNPNTGPELLVTFDQIIQEIRKLKNTSFYVDMTDPDNPIFRLEEASWFYTGTNVLTFTEPKEVKTSVKPGLTYGTVRVGSEYNPGGSSPVYTMNAGLSYYGFKEEVYTPGGQCNTDNELDLLNEFRISSNAINDQVNGVVSSNLEDVFLVECDTVDTTLFTAKAIMYTTYATPPEVFYNIGLNNVNKIALHGGNFQQAITNTQSGGTNLFRASMGQDTTLVDQTGGSGLNFPQLLNPVPFADEFGGGNYDPGGNYDNLLFFYEAPLPGSYSFTTQLNLEMENFKGCATGASILYVPTGQTIFTPVNYGFRVTLSIISYSDNTLTTITNSSTLDLVEYTNGSYIFPVTFVAPLAIGECVLVQVITQSERFAPAIFGMTPLTSDYIIQNCAYSPSEPRQKITAQDDSYFECTGTPDGGLTLAPFDPQLYRSKLHEFEYDISASDFQAVVASPLGLFTLIKDGVSRDTWIEQIQYNNWTGKARLIMISKDATT